MITRGTIIGKIIDDLARLMSQIELRNKVGLLDLTKVSEDFFKEVLNIVYDLNLINLNEKRVNEPGIDLGDSINKIAYQVTSTKTSEKVSKTLRKITPKQIEEYKCFKILIIGKKQNEYTIKDKLSLKINFNLNNDILDINGLTKDISTLDIDKLEMLFTFFKRSFRELIIELEPMDAEGNFESSVYHYVEQIPNHPPTNTKNIDEYYDEKNHLTDYVDIYHRLASIPKNQREYISLIAERGALNTNRIQDQYQISCTKLAGVLGIEEKKLFQQMAYLEEEEVIYFSDDKDEYDRPNYKYCISGEYLNYLIIFLKEKKLSIRKTIVAMDFSVL